MNWKVSKVELYAEDQSCFFMFMSDIFLSLDCLKFSIRLGSGVFSLESLYISIHKLFERFEHSGVDL